MYIGITKNRNCTIFIILMVPILFANSDPARTTSSSEGSQSTSLDNSNKPVEQFERSADCLRFPISYWWRIQSKLFLKYLCMDTSKAITFHLGFYYLLHTNIDINLTEQWTSLDLNPALRDQKQLCYHCATLHWLILIFFCFASQPFCYLIVAEGTPV